MQGQKRPLDDTATIADAIVLIKEMSAKLDQSLQQQANDREEVKEKFNVVDGRLCTVVR